MIDLGDVCGKKSRRNGIEASFDGRSITFFFFYEKVEGIGIWMIILFEG